MQTRKWQVQNGQERYTTEILADEMQMLGGNQGQDTQAMPDSKAPEAGQPTNNFSVPELVDS